MVVTIWQMVCALLGVASLLLPGYLKVFALLFALLVWRGRVRQDTPNIAIHIMERTLLIGPGFEPRRGSKVSFVLLIAVPARPYDLQHGVFVMGDGAERTFDELVELVLVDFARPMLLETLEYQELLRSREGKRLTREFAQALSQLVRRCEYQDSAGRFSADRFRAELQISVSIKQFDHHVYTYYIGGR